MLSRANRSLLALAIAALLTCVSAATAQQPSPSTTTTFRTAKSWGYQLTNLDVKTLAASPYDVLVIDYSRDGSDAQALTSADLTLLQRKPDGTRRIVLSYLSIGEAESYRFYWNKSWDDLWFIPNFWSKPAWRAKLNGDWGGNYAVRYWDPAWQRIMLGEGSPGQSASYLDRIIRAGFDGVWLDKVDSSLEDVAAKRPTARADMMAFVAHIAERGRAAKPGFLVVPQNGEDLLTDGGFRGLIDGFGKESLLFGEDGPQQPNPQALIDKRLALLKLLTAEGKPVLAVEYLSNRATADAATLKLTSLGLVPLAATRLLDVAPGTITASSDANAGSGNRRWGVLGWALGGILLLAGAFWLSRRVRH
jgi:cysteinyl-tRNA synthetase, unknown class